MRSVLVLLALCAAAPAIACGISETCTDTQASLTGAIISDGVRLGWSTDAEDSGVGSYAISRSNGGSWVPVGVIYRRGSCNVVEVYSYTDDPPNPDTDWTYRIQAIPPLGSPACAWTVDPS